MSRDQRIDQSATSIQSLLNTNGATFLMTSHVRSALWTLNHVDINWKPLFLVKRGYYIVPPIPSTALAHRSRSHHGEKLTFPKVYFGKRESEQRVGFGAVLS